MKLVSSRAWHAWRRDGYRDGYDRGVEDAAYRRTDDESARALRLLVAQDTAAHWRAQVEKSEKIIQEQADRIQQLIHNPVALLQAQQADTIEKAFALAKQEGTDFMEDKT